MAQNEFQLGDVVQLKSGSLPMTVKKTENHMVWCVYWDGINATLTHAEPLEHWTLERTDKRN